MRIARLFILLFIATSLLYSCDQVDVTNRYVDVSTNQPDSSDSMPDSAIVFERTVLLEEFTGQKCTNCPDAHRMVAQLLNQYGDRLISVAIHSGGFGIAESSSSAKMLGLMQPEGDVYANFWGVQAYPSGVVDRRGGVLAATDFASSIFKEMQRETEMGIFLNAAIDNVDGKQVIKCHVELESTVDIDGKLQLWVTESNIKAFQVDNGKPVVDYEHNHVYRACIKATEDQGFWGEDVAIKENIAMSFDRQIAVKDNWNPENLSVVAFVYNDKDGVYQAAECKVVPAAE